MKLDDLKLQAEHTLTKLKPLLRHHTFVVTVVLLGFLIFVVYSVSHVLQQPSDNQYRAQKEQSSIQTKFDQNAIKAINDLRTRDQATNNLTFTVERKRINPFTE